MQTLSVRIDAYFAERGLERRGHPRIVAKAMILFGWAAGSYSLLVSGGLGIIPSLACALSLSLALAGIGFNVMHDASHGSFSTSPFVNRLMAFSLDILGG